MRELQILKKIKKIVNKNVISDKEISLNDYFFLLLGLILLGNGIWEKLDKKYDLLYSIKSLKIFLSYSIADLQNYKLLNKTKKNNRKI